jgi:hypothetical protein
VNKVADHTPSGFTVVTEQRINLRLWVWGLGMVLAAAGVLYVLLWYGPDLIARHDVGNVIGPARSLRLQQASVAWR